jgi:hypothetical protein
LKPIKSAVQKNFYRNSEIYLKRAKTRRLECVERPVVHLLSAVSNKISLFNSSNLCTVRHNSWPFLEHYISIFMYKYRFKQFSTVSYLVGLIFVRITRHNLNIRVSSFFKLLYIIKDIMNQNYFDKCQNLVKMKLFVKNCKSLSH